METIIRYIARRNPPAARQIGLALYERVQNLAHNPEAGSLLEELPAPSWRKLIFRRWKIVYRLHGDFIVIGRIWPAAMGEADLETPLPEG